MRATGRRIGRIVGQLDDIYTLVDAYYLDELPGGTEVDKRLMELKGAIQDALSLAEAAAGAINARDGRSQ